MSSNVDLMVGNRPLSSLRVVDLKQELEKRGLSKSGSKKDLAERLKLHLQIEQHRDTGASADEEELPNYSQVHDELADQNPFIRDYLASQAELFHSQKVVKKLVEEEAKRESETSADESVDSPMKLPPALEREEIPVAEARNNVEPEQVQEAKKTEESAKVQEAKKTQELFHSQKVVKKLVEEEAKRESETSADESVDSRMKQPPALEMEEIPVAEAQNNVEPEQVQEAKKTEESAKVQEAKKTEELAEVQEAKKTEESAKVQEAKKTEESAKVQEAKKTQELFYSQNVVKKLVEEEAKRESETSADESVDSPMKLPPALEREEIPVTEAQNNVEPEQVQEAKKTEESAEVQQTKKTEESAEVQETKKTEESAEVQEAKKTEESAEVQEAKKTEESAEVQEAKKTEESAKVQEAKKTEESARVQKTKLIEETTISENALVQETTSGENKLSSPKAAQQSPIQKQSRREISPKLDTKEVSKDKPEESGSSSEDDESSSRSRDRSSSRSRSRSKSRSRSSSRSRGEDEKRSEPDENGEELRKATSRIIGSSSKKNRRSISKSASRSPAREKSPKLEKSETRPEESEKKIEPETKPDEKAEEKMDVDESSSPRYKSSQKETSYTNNDIAGEEALDYGEEEDDEDRNESDPQEFSWARRSLRLKTKASFAIPTCKWKLEEESKHLVVKSDLLNSYYDDIKLVPLEHLKLEEKSTEAATEVKKEVERKPSVTKEPEPDEPLPTRTVENVAPIIKRTVSIIPSTKTLAEDAEETEKALTPPRNPPSNVLLITNLVRPFTLIQLKEMLQRTGNLQDIWVDKIKSKCIAKFASQEEAFETRAALHGVCWPNSNPKSLHVDYTTQDNLDEHKAKEGAEQITPAEKPVSAQPLPVREWDVGKKAEPKSPRNRKRSRSRSTSRDRSKRSRRTPSPGRRRRSKSPANERRSRGGEGKEPEPMGKALDELFRKTIATPSIYWLPLTPEQIAEKEELRRKRMLERERRLAELSKIRR